MHAFLVLVRIAVGTFGGSSMTAFFHSQLLDAIRN